MYIYFFTTEGNKCAIQNPVQNFEIQDHVLTTKIIEKSYTKNIMNQIDSPDLIFGPNAGFEVNQKQFQGMFFNVSKTLLTPCCLPPNILGNVPVRSSTWQNIYRNQLFFKQFLNF